MSISGFRDSWDRVFKPPGSVQADWVTLCGDWGRTFARTRIGRFMSVPPGSAAGLLSCLAAETGVTIDRDLRWAWSWRLSLMPPSNRSTSSAPGRETEAHGQTVEGAAELQTTIAELEGMLAEALDNWPWTPTKEEWDGRGCRLPAR